MKNLYEGWLIGAGPQGSLTPAGNRRGVDVEECLGEEIELLRAQIKADRNRNAELWLRIAGTGMEAFYQHRGSDL